MAKALQPRPTLSGRTMRVRGDEVSVVRRLQAAGIWPRSPGQPAPLPHGTGVDHNYYYFERETGALVLWTPQLSARLRLHIVPRPAHSEVTVTVTAWRRWTNEILFAVAGIFYGALAFHLADWFWASMALWFVIPGLYQFRKRAQLFRGLETDAYRALAPDEIGEAHGLPYRDPVALGPAR
jgi:hypothetical protein